MQKNMVVILEAVPGLNFAIPGGLYAKYVISRFLGRGSGGSERDLDGNFGRNFLFLMVLVKIWGKNRDRKNRKNRRCSS